MESEQVDTPIHKNTRTRRKVPWRPPPHAQHRDSGDGSGWALRLADGPAATTHPILRYPFAMGRDDACDLVFSSPEVSRLHALILLDRENAPVIRDQQSTNGTFVNGVRVVKRQRLDDGDVVSLGPTGVQLLISRYTAPCRLVNECTELPEVSLRTPADSSWSSRSRVASRPTLPALVEPSETSATTVNELIQNNQFLSLAQPIVARKSHTVQALELLSAATSPMLPANPQHLLDIADEHGLAESVSRAMRVQQIEQATVRQDPAWQLFLNVHPREWKAYDALVDHLESLRQRFPTHAWTLEIHECTRIGVHEIRRAQRDLKHLRIDIAFDDFGVEQSRIIELLQAAPRFVKFDATLTRNLPRLGKKGQKAIERLIALTQSCGTQVIAEGVETDVDIKACEAVGFDLLQGYGTGRPFSMHSR